MFKVSSNKFQLIAVVILSLIILVVFISTFAYNQVSQKVISNTYMHLSSLQEDKKEEIKNWFQNYQNLLVSLAQSKMTQDSFIDFQKGFYSLSSQIDISKDEVLDKLKNEYETNYLNKVDYSIQNIQNKRALEDYLPENENALLAQYIYSKNNPNNKNQFNTDYEKVHSIYHDSYSGFLDAYNIYDIFMIDLKGNLIYSNFKEKDFATNLVWGPYKDSGLGKVYKKALDIEKGEIVFKDFMPYEPSYNTSASFMATPIYIKDKVVGVFVFQTSLSEINKIMQFNNNYEKVGLYKTGDNFLVGDDYKLRSNPRFLNKSNENFNIGIDELKVSSINNIINSNIDYKQLKTYNYLNNEVLSVISNIVLPGGN